MISQNVVILTKQDVAEEKEAAFKIGAEEGRLAEACRSRPAVPVEMLRELVRRWLANSTDRVVREAASDLLFLISRTKDLTNGSEPEIQCSISAQSDSSR